MLAGAEDGGGGPSVPSAGIPTKKPCRNDDGSRLEDTVGRLGGGPSKRPVGTELDCSEAGMLSGDASVLYVKGSFAAVCQSSGNFADPTAALAGGSHAQPPVCVRVRCVGVCRSSRTYATHVKAQMNVL
jgi:hypothetical protein